MKRKSISLDSQPIEPSDQQFLAVQHIGCQILVMHKAIVFPEQIFADILPYTVFSA
ncbi:MULTISPECIES: hypothetical protein [Gammaproteobacteria]|uniref:hypothetical protein n=1 Tax=Gammaproteobacteria TaxID=1236 RepID=UPI001ADC4527|nr:MULTISPECIES: hypothetical protein [Gammaproteobacteria]MBO9483631.1 hypothetical protein [Salinisphaera sp. G21_0]MBO9496445.1 hypothetical protein [Thalassotalea sp. G20_0]